MISKPVPKFTADVYSLNTSGLQGNISKTSKIYIYTKRVLSSPRPHQVHLWSKKPASQLGDMCCGKCVREARHNALTWTSRGFPSHIAGLRQCLIGPNGDMWDESMPGPRFLHPSVRRTHNRRSHALQTISPEIQTHICKHRSIILHAIRMTYKGKGSGSASVPIRMHFKDMLEQLKLSCAKIDLRITVWDI